MRLLALRPRRPSFPNSCLGTHSAKLLFRVRLSRVGKKAEVSPTVCAETEVWARGKERYLSGRSQPISLRFRHDLHIHRLAHLHLVARRRQFAGLRVDAECHHAVRILIGDHGPRPRRIDAKAARHLDPITLIRNVCHVAGFWINGERHNAVLAAVRAEDELARRMNDYFLRDEVSPLKPPLGSVERVCSVLRAP